MNRFTVILLLLIVWCALSLGMAIFLAQGAKAHGWYSEKSDPVFSNGCCGGSDCETFKVSPSKVTAELEGYRITLTLEEAREINPSAAYPIDALVPWDRVQPSEDGNYHLCIYSNDRTPPRNGVICFFEPPGT